MFSSAAALAEQTLEDEFIDQLEPSQVQAALQHSGGSLDAARKLCARLAAAAAQERQQQQGQQQCQQQAPAANSSHFSCRQWWPRSEFCLDGSSTSGSSSSAAGAPANGAASSSISGQRPRLLVPHQVVGNMRPGLPRTSSASSAAAGSRQSPAVVAPVRQLAGGSAGPATEGNSSSGSGRQPAGALTRGGQAAPNSGSSSGSTSSAPPPTPLSGFPPVRQPAELQQQQQGQQQQQQQQQQQGQRAAPLAAAAPRPAAAPAPEPLQPHYAAVFLTDRSRQQLLHYVSPLHEEVSADHMTMAYKPTPAQCCQLPLGREAALFVTGAAANYRAQAVAVEHPSWLPFLSESTPHVTVSVGDGVPAKEAGDLTAEALQLGHISPVAKLKLLQGTVGVQLTDGRRVFSVQELRAALAEAAAAAGQAGAGAAPRRILQRGQAPPAALPAAAVAAPLPAAAAAAARDTGPAEAGPIEPAVPPRPPAAALPAPLPCPLPGSSGGGGSAGRQSVAKAAAWDLDSLLDQLHLADQQPAAARSSGGGGSSNPGVAPGNLPAQAAPRRGILKLPSAVAAEMAAPAGSSGNAAAGQPRVLAASRPPAVLARRPPQQAQQQRLPPEPPQVEPAAAPLPVLGKSVAEEAADAAAGEEPLDFISSLASLVGPETAAPAASSSSGAGSRRPDGKKGQQRALPAARAGIVFMPSEPPPVPSPKMLEQASAGGSSSEAGSAAPAAAYAAGAAGAAAGSSGYETSSSSTAAASAAEEEASSAFSGAGAAAGAAAGASAPVDPEMQQLLQLQFPELHALVVETALRMHGGSLQAAAQFLAVLDHQQQELGLAGQGAGAGFSPGGPRSALGRQPEGATLGSFLQQALPESATPPSPSYEPYPSAAGRMGLAAGSAAGGGGFADPYHPGGFGTAAGGGGGGVTAGLAFGEFGGGQRPGMPTGRGWQGLGQGQGGVKARGGRGKAAGRRNSTAGDDPMSVAERQAMNLHLSAKRLYTQASQEAFASGQVALAKEMQTTARVHADAANAARRRANVSAFRSTNASVVNTFTLDLHGQHVDEALASLERYLLTLGGLGHPGGVLLQVITGSGRHSHGNQPRVLPAVVRYLADAGYKFDAPDDNPGMLLVSIGC